MNIDITPEQKSETEKVSSLISTILSQYKLKFSINNQIILSPMEETPEPVVDVPVEPSQAPETAPQSEESPIVDSNTE